MPEPLFTIGHSTRSIPEFVELLRAGRVERVVDVRSISRSRRNPDYNLDALPDTLASYQIGHVHIPELGGLRKASKDVPPETNGWWSNRSFHNYADHALTDEFRAGLARLLDLAAERRTAIMCAEAVWWRCHRRIVSDYAILRGREVFHLMGTHRVDPASMNPAARPCGDTICYPAETGEEVSGSAPSS